MQEWHTMIFMQNKNVEEWTTFQIVLKSGWEITIVILKAYWKY